MTTLIMAVIFLAGFIGIFVGLATFDSLVHRLHRNHRDEWEACGRPAGIFRTPQEVADLPFRNGFASSVANSRLMWRWLFCTPKWMKQEPDAQRLAVKMRIAVFVVIVAWVLLGLPQIFGMQ